LALLREFAVDAADFAWIDLSYQFRIGPISYQAHRPADIGGRYGALGWNWDWNWE
jgi:hypothetical protein